MKTMVAAVCVVAAGMGGFKAYHFANQTQADMLLAENVEALSDPDGDNGTSTIAQGQWVFDRKDSQTKTVNGKQTEVYYYVYVCNSGDWAYCKPGDELWNKL